MSLAAYDKWLKNERGYSEHTARAYFSDARQFLEFLRDEFDGMAAESAESGHIKTFLVSLIEQGMEKSSVDRKRISLRVFYDHLLRKRVVQFNPASAVRPLKHIRKLPSFLSEKEMEPSNSGNYFGDDAEGRRSCAMIELLYSTGIRVSEMTGLNLGDWRPEDGVIRVLGKGNKERIIPFPVSLTAVMNRYLEVRNQEVSTATDSPLFVTNSGRRVYPMLVYRVVRRYIESVSSIEKRGPHTLRHTYATQLLNRDADLNAIKELLGHSSLAATQRYTHVTFEKLKNIHKKAHPRG